MLSCLEGAKKINTRSLRRGYSDYMSRTGYREAAAGDRPARGRAARHLDQRQLRQRARGDRRRARAGAARDRVDRERRRQARLPDQGRRCAHLCAAPEHRQDPGSPFAGAALPVRRHRFPAVRRKAMKARTWLALAVAAGAALLQGCELALIGASAGAAYSTLEDRRSSGTQLDDDAIELRAGSRIADRFADKVHVNVAAFNRATLITGEVPDEAVRAEVEKIVQGVPNVRGVTNEVQLAPITSLGERTSDSLITAQVKARYLRAKAFNPVHVKVVTEAGVVYLMGVVTEREADDAVDLARTGGVRKVVKIFEYCKAAEQVCRPGPPGPPDEKPKPAA